MITTNKIALATDVFSFWLGANNPEFDEEKVGTLTLFIEGKDLSFEIKEETFKFKKPIDITEQLINIRFMKRGEVMNDEILNDLLSDEVAIEDFFYFIHNRIDDFVEYIEDDYSPE